MSATREKSPLSLGVVPAYDELKHPFKRKKELPMATKAKKTAVKSKKKSTAKKTTKKAKSK